MQYVSVKLLLPTVISHNSVLSHLCTCHTNAQSGLYCMYSWPRVLNLVFPKPLSTFPSGRSAAAAAAAPSIIPQRTRIIRE